MTPPRAASADRRQTSATSPSQTPEQIAAALEAFLGEHAKAAFFEEGKLLFDMRVSKYSLSTEYGRCTLQLWNEEANVVRRIVSATPRQGMLRLLTQRFGHTQPTSLDVLADPDRRTESTRETTRKRFLRLMERLATRHFHGAKLEGLRTAMDLEKSFGPAYARGLMLEGAHTWAVIGVNAAETQATIDGILTVGILWLAECRERFAGRRVLRGLRLFVPRGTAVLTLSRLPWLSADAAHWELWEFDDRTEELEQREAADQGNISTHIVHAPSEAAARDRFAEPIAQVMALVPAEQRQRVTLNVKNPAELGLHLHGLEFARIRVGYAGASFRTAFEITVGAGPSETLLSPASEPALQTMVEQLFARRIAGGDTRDALFRAQPERWLESVLRQDVSRLDAHLNPAHVYTQVPAFAASDRGMLDLLGVLDDGRLAVLELKADDDLHLALQGLDYWVRVRWHQSQTADSAHGPSYGLGEFQRHGYFTGLALSEREPRLYLVAPALRIHPATEVVLRHLSPRVDWELVALDERWREQVRVVWRKRPGDLHPHGWRAMRRSGNA